VDKAVDASAEEATHIVLERIYIDLQKILYAVQLTLTVAQVPEAVQEEVLELLV
jgi:hypothetical protein